MVVGSRLGATANLGLLLGRAPGALGLAGLEAVLESPGDVLEVAHAAGADRLSPLGLLAPVDCTIPPVSI